MSLARNLAAIVVAAVTVAFLDAVWLGLLVRDFVHQELGPLLLEQPSLLPAALFYLLYAVGVLVFAVRPALADGGWPQAARLGAMLGLTCYLTYDLNNLATLKAWSPQFAGVNILWGGLVTAAAACTGYAAARASILGTPRVG
jgi:uncharacterized membrane protein